MPKVQKLTEKPHFLLRTVIGFAIAALVLFCVFRIVGTQNTIEERKLKKIALQEEIDVVTAENEELAEITQSEDISRYMEKLAVENGSYSYAYPDERRYYDTSRD